MQVHQVGLFVLAIFIGGGVLLLGVSLLALLKTKRLKDYQDKKMILSAFLFTLYGTWFASRACDMPHHESHRTFIIAWVLLPCVAVGLALAYLLKRAQKNAALTEQGTDES